MRVSLERAQQLALDSLRALGYSGEDCRTIASHLMDCELRGLEYAGLARILSFERSAALRAERLARGSIDLEDVVYAAVAALAESRER